MRGEERRGSRGTCEERIKSKLEGCFKVPRQKLREESRERNCRVMQSSSRTRSLLPAMQIGYLVCVCVCVCVCV